MAENIRLRILGKQYGHAFFANCTASFDAVQPLGQDWTPCVSIEQCGHRDASRKCGGVNCLPVRAINALDSDGMNAGDLPTVDP